MLIYDPRISNVAFIHAHAATTTCSYEKPLVRRLSKQEKMCCQHNFLRGTVITPVQHLVASCSPKRIKFGHGDTVSTAHR